MYRGRLFLSVARIYRLAVIQSRHLIYLTTSIVSWWSRSGFYEGFIMPF